MTTNQHLSRAASLVLALCLFFGAGLAESGGAADSDALDYNGALSMLTASSLTDSDKLEDIRQLFEQAGSYRLGIEYLTFTETLLLLHSEEETRFDKALDNIQRLARNETFLQDYTGQLDKAGRQALPDLFALMQYIRALKLEFKGDREGAIALYDAYPVLDAVSRAGKLSNAIREEKYAEACRLMEEGSFASIQAAATLFENLGEYLYSQEKLIECRQTIAALGPTPTPASTPVPSATITVYYMSVDGTLLQTDRVTFPVGQGLCLANDAFVQDGYKLVGERAVNVAVSGDGTVTPESVTYRYALLPTAAPTPVPVVQVPVYYMDSNGTLLHTDYVALMAGTNECLANDAFVPEGYTLFGGRSVKVTINPDGTASPGSITFTYLKPQKTWKPVAIGSTVIFGQYEQNNNKTNGKEPIVWRVLAVEDGKVLLISDYSLDSKQYHSSRTSVTWEYSSLRNWLNSSFLNTAFTAAEQKAILRTSQRNEANPIYGTVGGGYTYDWIFLLSIDEAMRYFAGSDMQVQNTMYARAQGASDKEGYGWWWLRSPGQHRYYAAAVNRDGALDAVGNGVDVKKGGVRPAIWVSQDSGIF